MNANETLYQLCGGGAGKLKMMIGASAFAKDDNSIQFSFKMCKKANRIVIRLNGRDLYDMEFYKFSPQNGTCPLVKEFNDLYEDMLRNIFENYTGLCVSL